VPEGELPIPPQCHGLEATGIKPEAAQKVLAADIPAASKVIRLARLATESDPAVSTAGLIAKQA
jgi:hypothetical protein